MKKNLSTKIPKTFRNLLYVVYFALVFSSLVIAFLNLPPIFDLQDQVRQSSAQRSRLSSQERSQKQPEFPEIIPENEKPFRWMENLKLDEMQGMSKRKTPQYKNLTNLLEHKIFLSMLTEKLANFSSRLALKKLPFMSQSTTNPVVNNFYQGITSESLYPVNSPWLEWIKTLLRSNKIVYAENKNGGSQLKLSVRYEANVLGLLKPMRLTRSQQTFPDHFYFVDLERHNAEIAAYHLDQLLDFRRAPPVVGRWINLTELWKISDHRLTRTFFKSPAENTCFHGTCDYYCRTETPICGHPHTVEVSIALYLPDSRHFPRSMTVHPYRRSYTKTSQESWIKDESYCRTKLMADQIYSTSRRKIYDITDLAIFDFLIGNMDRHHYEMFEDLGEDSFILHLDQGKAFGRHSTDELSILAPLTQCCKVRWKTWTVILNIVNNGGHLGDLLHDSLEEDLLSPVLLDDYYEALDRRLKLVVVAVQRCIANHDPKQVFDRTFQEQGKSVMKDSISQISN